jgi:hypothetical protein
MSVAYPYANIILRNNIPFHDAIWTVAETNPAAIVKCDIVFGYIGVFNVG